VKLLGTGIDIVETGRIAESIRRHGEPFLARIFTESERQYCASMKNSEPCYAARFAAKEAISKAFGTGIGGQLGWHDMEIRRRATGEPFVVLQGEGAATARRLGIEEVRLSMSHSEHYAVAHAFALGAD
jgi:holo-[acyl-carrier protein] synthase